MRSPACKTAGFTLACALLLTGCSRSGEPTTPVVPIHREVPPPEATDLTPLGGAKVLFQRDDGFETYLADGSTHQVSLVPLPPVTSGFWTMNAALSPDGSSIAYRAYSGLNTAWDIFVANVDGSGSRRIAGFEGNFEGPPSWSPDGNDVVYYLSFGNSGASYSPRVAVYRQPLSPPGAEHHLIDTGDYQVGGPCLYAEGLGHDPMVLSIDGKVAVACALDGDVFVFDVASGARTGQAVFSTHQWNTVHAVSWSPDGQRLAFIQAPVEGASGPMSLNVVEMQTGVVTTLATIPNAGWGQWSPGIVYSACWLPSGAAIVFTMADGELTSHVYVVPATGGAVVPLTTAAGVSDRSVSCAR